MLWPHLVLLPVVAVVHRVVGDDDPDGVHLQDQSRRVPADVSHSDCSCFVS